MFKRLFGSSQSFTVERVVYRRKSAIHILPTNDEDKNFKRSIKKVAKTSEDEKQIRAAIEQNEFISHIIAGRRFQAILRTIYSQEVQAGEVIIQEGEIGSQLFISSSGKFQVTTSNGSEFTFEDNRVFGELALLYNEKRKATIKAVTDGRIWVLENQVFKEIAKRSEDEEIREVVNFLKEVPILKKAALGTLKFVADLLVPQFFSTGYEIIKEGTKGDSFYIIRAGSVIVKTNRAGVVARLGRGQFFGELALLYEDVRKATVQVEPPGCDCYVLSRKHFIKHFGDIKDFRKISISYRLENLKLENTDSFEDLELEDLRRLKTIGAGGFGRVDIVQHKTKEHLVFALKYLKKYKCVLTEQRDHVLNEKNIQMNCSCPFIIRLYKTFRDNRYLYFLMEAQLGGDLWRLMYYERRRPFDELDAKFYVACVIDAFQYLHVNGIVYRDLKPENLLIADNGYVKLTDFGFAKNIAKGKTHSMVGTPDYMPPEIVLNKSHDRAVDLWTLGIFIFELITLKTPFKACCDHDTYNMILKGIDFCRFPNQISSKAKHIIRKLCKSRATDRLGYSKSGFSDIKRHPWFQHFHWDSFGFQEMRAPYIPKMSGPLDLSHFAIVKDETSFVPEDLSDWDEEFSENEEPKKDESEHSESNNYFQIL